MVGRSIEVMESGGFANANKIAHVDFVSIYCRATAAIMVL